MYVQIRTKCKTFSWYVHTYHRSLQFNLRDTLIRMAHNVEPVDEMELLSRLSKEVLQASEMVSARLEDGLSLLLGDGGPALYHERAADLLSDSNFNRYEDLDDVEGLTEEEIQHFLQEGMVGGSPLEGIADHVMGDIMSRQVGPSTPMEQFQAFRAAITWSESFIVFLLLFQVTMFLISVWVSRTSRGLTPRLVFMTLIGFIVRSAETLNGIGARRWERFASQNYFDKQGVFVGIMLCGPLLLDSFFMLVCFVYEASQLLVHVKKEEIRRKKKNSKEKKVD